MTALPLRAALLPAGALLAAFAVAAAPPAPEAPGTWIGTWAAAPQQPFEGETAHWEDQTLRLVVHASAGGAGVRVQVSNAHGDAPLAIGAVHVALRTAGADIAPASDRTLRFLGSPGIVLPPGADATSDPVGLDVPPSSDLAVSLYLPRASAGTTTHSLALQAGYVSRRGDAGGAARFPVAATIAQWPFLTRVDVLAPAPAATVVVFGDSLVDGDGSTPGANRRFGDALAARLRAAGARVGVVNEGIAGNRLLRPSPAAPRNPYGPGFGDAGVDRFERDALRQPGVAAIVLRIGGNDLGFPGAIAPDAEAPSFEALVEGYRLLAARAHRRGLRIVATTCPPFEDAAPVPGYWAAAKEPLRQRINAWLREAKTFDAVVDLDRLMRDPARPSRLARAFDSGDHLHPGDAGYAAMAAAVPLAALGLGIPAVQDGR
jgi:lysophospholipase L1-like esterase